MGEFGTNEVKVIGDVLYVTDNYLISKGVSANYIRKAISISDSSNWERLKLKGQKRLIFYKSIPKSFKDKHSLPTNDDLREEILIQEQNEKQHLQDIKDHYIIDILLQAENTTYTKHLARFLDLYPDCHEKARHYAKKAAIIEACIKLISKENPDRIKIIKLHKVYKSLELHKKYKASQYKDFTSLIKEAQNSIYATIKHKSQGAKKKNIKTQAFHKRYIKVNFGHGSQKTMVAVYKGLKAECEKRGLAVISLPMVKHLIYTNGLHNIVALDRYGKDYTKSNILPYIPRKKAEFAGSKWVIDGTPVQFIAKDENGKQVRLNLFIAIDVMSKKVVGSAFGLTENRFIVENALHNAVKLNGHIAGEIVSDNSSAITSTEMKLFFERYEKSGGCYRNAIVGNAQDKEVEQAFQKLNYYLKDLTGYIGGNIAGAKDPNNRPSKEYLSKVYKENGVPNIDTLSTQVLEVIDQYNIDESEGRKAPSRLYNESEKPNAINLEPHRIAFLFWSSTKYTVKNAIVILAYDGIKKHYSIYDPEKAVRLAGKQVMVKYDRENQQEVHLFNMKTEQFICEARLIKQPNGSQCEATVDDKLEMIKQASHNKAIIKYLEDKDKKEREEFQKATGEHDAPLTDMFLLRKEALVNSELSEFNKMLNLSDIDLGNVEPYKPIKGIKYNDESEEMNVYKATEKGSLKVIKTNANEITNR